MRTWSPRGLPLVGGYVVFVAGLVGAIVAIAPGEEEMRAVIRVTAFTSVVPFLLAFTASALASLWSAPATHWLVANRRYLGLSFAASHVAHGLAIAALARHSPSFAASVPVATLVGGGLGYAFIALMATTSNDAAQRRLGRAWGLLHTVGIYYLWFVFLFTYMGAVRRSAFHLVMVLFLAAGWLLRLAARPRRRAMFGFSTERRPAPADRLAPDLARRSET